MARDFRDRDEKLIWSGKKGKEIKRI